MSKINNFDIIQNSIHAVKSHHLGYLTNFYIDVSKINVWINRDLLNIHQVGKSVFITRRNINFQHLYYISTDKITLKNDLDFFLNDFQSEEFIIDIVGSNASTNELINNIKELEFVEYKSLVRMSRLISNSDKSVEIDDSEIKYADIADIKDLEDLLDRNFDSRAEQIPFYEELEFFIRNKKIIVVKNIEAKIIGFVIFELNGYTSYLRYWFVDEKYREQKIGSKLLRQFFWLTNSSKRQLFWVIQDNHNAIKRYMHYGFQMEDMIDKILKIDNFKNNERNNFKNTY
jgi:ribosomal protein S18 acetylase RimI-like enzyme